MILTYKIKHGQDFSDSLAKAKQDAKITFGIRETNDNGNVKVNAYDIINIEPEHAN